MRVRLDREACTGHGLCYAMAGTGPFALFDSDDEGHSVLLDDGELSPERLELARTAEVNCPERAITVIED
jgi:ferredoxin